MSTPNQSFAWVAQYVGVPFMLSGRNGAKLDCWGLVQRIYREQLQIELPDYAGENSPMIAKVWGNGHPGWKELQTPNNMCVVAMSSRGKVMHHVGIYLACDGGVVLHATEPRSRIETLNSLRLHGYHTLRYYAAQ